MEHSQLHTLGLIVWLIGHNREAYFWSPFVPINESMSASPNRAASPLRNSITIEALVTPYWNCVTTLETRLPHTFVIRLGAHCGRYRLYRWGEGLCRSFWSFIKLVTNTTYCNGHKLSYSPNLSFKHISLCCDASAVLLLVRRSRQTGGRRRERGSDGWGQQAQEELTFHQKCNEQGADLMKGDQTQGHSDNAICICKLWDSWMSAAVLLLYGSPTTVEKQIRNTNGLTEVENSRTVKWQQSHTVAFIH